MPDSYEDEGYTIETGAVIAVAPDHVVVRLEKREEDCGGCRSCAMKNLCGGRDAGHIDLRTPLAAEGDRPETGDAVRVAYRPANAALAAVVMFLPALAGLLLGGLAGYRLGGGDDDAVFVLGCLIGLAAGVGTSAALSRLSPALKPSVRIVPDRR